MKTMAIQNEAALDAMLLYALGKMSVSAEMLPVIKNRVKINQLEDGRCEATFPDLDETVEDPITACIDKALVAVGFKKDAPKPDNKEPGKEKNDGGAGGSGGKDDDETPAINPWKKETFNLTRQLEIRRENSVLADRMEAEAKQTQKAEPRQFYHGFEM
jgi:hypothetical protein